MRRPVSMLVVLILALTVVATNQPPDTNQRSFSDARSQLDAVENRLLNKMDTIYAQYQILLQRQKDIQEQLNMMLSLQGQVLSAQEHLRGLDTRVNSLELRMERIEDLQSPDGGNIKLLQAEVNMMIKLGTWTLASVGGLLVTAIGWALKRDILPWLHSRRKAR